MTTRAILPRVTRQAPAVVPAAQASAVATSSAPIQQPNQPKFQLFDNTKQLESEKQKRIALIRANIRSRNNADDTQADILGYSAIEKSFDNKEFLSQVQFFNSSIDTKTKTTKQTAFENQVVAENILDSEASEIKTENQIRTELLNNRKNELDIYEISEKQSQFSVDIAANVESWLRSAMPSSASTRESLQTSMSQLTQKLNSLTDATAEKIKEYQDQISQIAEELSEVQQAEIDLAATFDRLRSNGQEVLAWITDYVRIFFEKLREKLNKLWNMFYLVFIEIIPSLVSKLQKAILDPFYSLLGDAWNRLKAYGSKVTGVFGDGINAAVKWFKAKGGELTGAAMQSVQGLYDATSAKMKAVWYLGTNTVHILSTAGSSVKNVVLTLVDGVWKNVSNPIQQLVIAGITKYFQAIWSDPRQAKFIIEVMQYGRDKICERVSNLAYDPRFKDVTAYEKAKQEGGSYFGKGLEYAQWAAANASLEWMSDPEGLGNAIKNSLGAGFKGIRNVVSFKSLLGTAATGAGGLTAIATGGIATPAGIGLAAAGSVLGASIDSGLDYIFSETIDAMGEAATAAAFVKAKNDTLSQHFDFWVRFFTDDCVYPREYAVNTTGWTQSTVNLLSLGFYGQKPETIPLTRDHIELENKLVEQRKRRDADEKQLADLVAKNAPIEDIAKLRVSINEQRKEIARNDAKIDIYVAEAKESLLLKETGNTPKGLWNALGLPSSQIDAYQKLKSAGSKVSNWVFNLTDLYSLPSKDADLTNYINQYKKLVDQKLDQLKVANNEILLAKNKLVEEMQKLKNLETSNQITLNPFTWVGSGVATTDIEKQAQIVKQLSSDYERRMALIDQLMDEYLQLNGNLLNKGLYNDSGPSLESQDIEQLASMTSNLKIN